MTLLLALPLKAQDIPVETLMATYPLDTIDGKIFYRYPVEKSIGLYRVSKNFGVSQDEIMKYNPSVAQTGLRYGETVLLIPAGVAIEPATPKRKDAVKAANPSVMQPVMEPKFESKKPSGLSKRTDNILELGIIAVARQDTITSADTLMRLDSIVPVDSTILADTVMFTGPKARKIALLLPLHAKAVERDDNMDRFFEYYTGTLMALNDVQSDSNRYELYVYDTERSVNAIKKLLAEGVLRDMDVIMGPAYPAQVLALSDSLKSYKVPAIIPFVDRVVGLETNPYLLQFNAADTLRAQRLAQYLAERGDINIVLPDAKETDIPRSVQAMREAFKTYDLPTTAISIHDIVNDSLSRALKSDKENYLLFNTEKYTNLSVILPMIQRGIAGYNVTLISPYSWQNEHIAIPQLFTSSFSADNDSLLNAYEEKHKALYGSEHVSTYPRYDLLGYDIMKEMDAFWHEEEFHGLQSNIHYERIDSIGGYQNTGIEVVRKE